MAKRVVIIGAGPAGLGAATELTKKKNDFKITIVDKNDIIGGLARTHAFHGSHFDVGPHRFYTKNKEVLSLWKNTLKTDFVEVPRLTRMFYKGKLFLYPVEFGDIIRKFGFRDTAESMLSYLHAKLILRNMKPKTFEDWITKNFGKKLYIAFFKTYTEKVWGVPCDKIGSEWAAQRIKNTNFVEVVKNAVWKPKVAKAKTWVDQFYYPINGAGQMYTKLADKVLKKGAKILLEKKIVRIYHKDSKVTSVVVTDKNNETSFATDALFSSMPLTQFVLNLSPAPPTKILKAARNLRFRDHITVNFIIKGINLFPDNWIYIHDPNFKMARIANYNNFAKSMAGKNESAISVEYFTFKTDKLWKMADEKLLKLAKSELVKAKFIKPGQVKDGFVVRESESYPTYYMGHQEHFNELKRYVDQFENLYLIGRGGMFKYNNMDHSIYSGMLAARNLLAGRRKYNVWNINEDAEYLEGK